MFQVTLTLCGFMTVALPGTKKDLSERIRRIALRKVVGLVYAYGGGGRKGVMVARLNRSSIESPLRQYLTRGIEL